jgi:hypothetical protein
MRPKCECGTITGTPCDANATPPVFANWMPDALRESHGTDFKSVRWPRNGAKRLVLHPSCAALAIEANPEWSRTERPFYPYPERAEWREVDYRRCIEEMPDALRDGAQCGQLPGWEDWWKPDAHLNTTPDGELYRRVFFTGYHGQRAWGWVGVSSTYAREGTLDDLLETIPGAGWGAHVRFQLLGGEAHAVTWWTVYNSGDLERFSSWAGGEEAQ